MREIDIYAVSEKLRIGQVEDREGATGVTVLYCADGMPAGLDVRGGGPASRESELLKPMANASVIHSVVLSGGSAFGLDAAGGVMRYLEERGIGYNVGVAIVPLVCQSDIFDLGIGSVKARPDGKMGYAACEAAEKANYKDGCYGAGTGATVGKVGGKARCMKSGIGSYAVQLGDLKIGAIVAVNALGDIYDPETGRQIAGMLNEAGDDLASCKELMYAQYDKPETGFTGNTTIGAIFTNASFDKTKLCKIAGMAHDGMARAVNPVHTSADGDSLYALSLGDLQADPNTVGTLAADVVAKAIVRAVKAAEPSYGLKAYRDLH